MGLSPHRPKNPIAPRGLSRAAVCAVLALILYAFGARLGASPFEEGNSFFREGKYTEAETAYEKALVENDTPAIRFNLGRVREALGDPAGAILEWERARRLAPGHKPSTDAILALRKATGTLEFSDFWMDRLNFPGVVGRELWVLAIGLWLSVFGIWSALTSRLPRSGPVYAVVGLSIGIAGSFWKHQADMDSELALTRERSVTVRAAPADPAKSLGELPMGTPVRITGHSAGWNHCEIPRRGPGWIPAKSLERISSAPVR